MKFLACVIPGTSHQAFSLKRDLILGIEVLAFLITRYQVPGTRYKGVHS